MPTISVVIPCLNEEKYLPLLLDDLAGQTKKPDEVIVADCESIDKTVDVAKSFTGKLTIKVATSRVRSPGAARNAGTAKASSDYLLFIDADMRLPANAVKAIDQSLKNRAVDFLTPRFASDGRSFADVFHVWLIHWWIKTNTLFRRPTGIGGVMCVRRSVDQRIGGFNPVLNIQDDRDYYLKLREIGASCNYLQELITITSSRRFEGQGLLSSGVAIILQDARLARWLEPVLKKMGKNKKYGNYR